MSSNLQINRSDLSRIGSKCQINGSNLPRIGSKCQINGSNLKISRSDLQRMGSNLETSRSSRSVNLSAGFCKVDGSIEDQPTVIKEFVDLSATLLARVRAGSAAKVPLANNRYRGR